VPFKNDRNLVKNLYAGLRFFAQQQFDALRSQVDRNRCNGKQLDTAALKHYSQEHRRCLGLVVRELRTGRGLTQHEVAKRAKVSLLWVQRLVDNQPNANFSIGRLYRVARGLGVELYDLYERADEMAGPTPWLKA
jgi:hypothetical protein